MLWEKLRHGCRPAAETDSGLSTAPTGALRARPSATDFTLARMVFAFVGGFPFARHPPGYAGRSRAADAELTAPEMTPPIGSSTPGIGAAPHGELPEGGLANPEGWQFFGPG